MEFIKYNTTSKEFQIKFTEINNLYILFYVTILFKTSSFNRLCLPHLERLAYLTIVHVCVWVCITVP